MRNGIRVEEAIYPDAHGEICDFPLNLTNIYHLTCCFLSPRLSLSVRGFAYLNKMRYTAKYYTKWKITVKSRAYCGPTFIAGGSKKHD